MTPHRPNPGSPLRRPPVRRPHPQVPGPQLCPGHPAAGQGRAKGRRVPTKTRFLGFGRSVLPHAEAPLCTHQRGAHGGRPDEPPAGHGETWGPKGDSGNQKQRRIPTPSTCRRRCEPAGACSLSSGRRSQRPRVFPGLLLTADRETAASPPPLSPEPRHQGRQRHTWHSPRAQAAVFSFCGELTAAPPL